MDLYGSPLYFSTEPENAIDQLDFSEKWILSIQFFVWRRRHRKQSAVAFVGFA